MPVAAAYLGFVDAKDTLILLAVVTSVLVALVLGRSASRSLWFKETQTPSEHASDKAPEQVLNGLPDPEPLVDFDLATAETKNYIHVNKTIRHPYFQTMAHQPMHVNDWLEIDKRYPHFLAERKRIIRTQGARVIDSMPENHAAAGELLQLIVDHMPKRFPTLFEAQPDGILNKVTGESFSNCSTLMATEALQVVARLAQGDFVMAQERENGRFYCTGGVVTSPGFYMLGDLLDKSMHLLHAPVPDFNQKLLKSVERTFKRFKPEEPFERSSWTIVDDYNLLRHHLVDMPAEATLEDSRPQDLILRIDHQTFRKLPRTGAIVFGGHPILIPLSDLADDPLVPALLKTVYETASKDLMEYKRAGMYRKGLVKYLEELSQRQVERGLIQGTEDVARFRESAK